MLTQNLCLYLEYQITGALTHAADIDIRRCWCDGVLLPESEQDYSLSIVMQSHCIRTKAWIDEGRERHRERGQFLYDLTIWLGEKSLQQYQNGMELTACVPEADNDDWIILDRQHRTIEIQLL
ncbi:hypothetical protein ACTHGU_07905 [Chitinophagaceae bacterium MMS25-I14]